MMKTTGMNNEYAPTLPLGLESSDCPSSYIHKNQVFLFGLIAYDKLANGREVRFLLFGV